MDASIAVSAISNVSATTATSVASVSPFAWILFSVIVIGLLAFDLGFFARRDKKEVSLRANLLMSGLYVVIALLFGVWVWSAMGEASAKAYLTGYLVEETLSMDNIFVMSLIFNFMAIPPAFQRRVLFWGILGAVVFRGLMIGVGAVLVASFHWVLYLFAAFLLFTGLKMLLSKDDAPDIAQNPFLKFLRNHFNITPELHGEKFFVRQPDRNGKVVSFMTPLFVTLLLIEFADIIFAFDSVPAIFAITTDPFIVFTSNIFAILGLRSLYFSLSAIIDRFKYLKVSLALILVFIGAKVIIPPLFKLPEVSNGWSLGVTVGLLAAGVLASLYATRNTNKPLRD